MSELGQQKFKSEVRGRLGEMPVLHTNNLLGFEDSWLILISLISYLLFITVLS